MGRMNRSDASLQSPISNVQSAVEPAWFIPGTPALPGVPLARYRPAQPLGAAAAYVGSLTQPGDLVVDLFCQGPAVVRETVALERRALGLSVNPLLIAATRLGLSPRGAASLNAAFTRLADSPKGDVPLRHHLASLYHSACPVCRAPGLAVWFAWDRDGNYPFEKAVRCPACGEVQQGALDEQDLRAVERTRSRGLAYYYALDRVAPPGHPARERAAELVELYTPRNLSALMDLSMRLEGLEADEGTKLALAGVLLDCFDAGSSLDPYGEERPRPRTLRVPSRYVERNVWLCFEEAFSRLLAETLPPLPSPVDVSALAKAQAGGYALAGRAARNVGEIIPPASVALIFADPPRPDGVFWALSALWAGWLWESPAARAMRPFLRRRRFVWDWHWRVLRSALAASGELLTAGGHLVTLFSDADESLLESACLAASGAGYVLEGWGYSPEVGYRLVWRWKSEIANGKWQIADSKLQITAVDVDALEREVMAVVEEAAVTALRERGEPTTWALLHASACVELVRRGLLARAAVLLEDGDSPLAMSFIDAAVRRAFEAAPVTQIADREGAGGDLLWLQGSDHAADQVEHVASLAAEPPVVSAASLPAEPPVVSGAEPPLADRVEDLVRTLLVRRPDWGADELIEAIYARFPGHLTPDLTLVHMCVDSYSVREGETLRLRAEDEPQRRAAELGALRADLAELGERLGFEVRGGDAGDMCWLEDGREVYAFAISATAALALYLLRSLPVSAERGGTDGASGEVLQRCLVLPGGRAQLVGLKLQRDPRLVHAVEAGGWQFIKFRQLRRLVVEEELDRHALKTVLGLDPIAEQEAAQIPLF